MHCVSRDTYSVCKTEVMDHWGGCHCCRMCPNCYYYCNYVTIIAIIVSIIRIIPQPKVAFRVGIHCRLQANRIIHHGRTVLAASSSGVDSIIDHQGAFSHNKAHLGHTILLSVHTTDVGKPPGTHGRTKLIAQVINGLGNQRPLVLPHVVCKSKILTNLKIMRIISIIRIIDIIRIICIICITLSLGVRRC